MRAQSFVIPLVLMMAASTTSSQGQSAAPTEPGPQQQPSADASAAPAASGLSDLDAMTFACPKAGLNAAAREAVAVPSQGTYQFSFFRIVSDSHHASYEVHFKSNYPGEPDLKYCVEVYCQQGWDPKNTKTSVRRLSDKRPRGAPEAHVSECAHKAPPAKRPVKR
jgi:hypothetical protein